MRKQNILAKLIAIPILIFFTLYSFSDDQKSPIEKEIDKLIMEGWKLQSQKNHEEALFRLNLALEESEKRNYKFGIGYSNLYIADILRISQPQRSIKLSSNAHEIAQIINDNFLKSSSLRVKGIALFYFGNTEEALDAYSEALEISREAKNIDLEVNLLVDLINLNASINEYTAALRYGMQALEISQEQGNKENQARANKAIGEIYYNSGNLSGALDFHLKAKNLFKEIRNSNGHADCCDSLAIIYTDLGDNLKAQYYTNIAIKIGNQEGNKVGERLSLIRSGNLSLQLGNKDEALKSYKKALSLSKNIGKREEAECLARIGFYFIRYKDYKAGVKYLKQGLSNLKNVEDKILLKNIFTQLAYANYFLNKLTDAYEYFKKSLEINLEIKNTRGIHWDYYYMGMIFARLNEEKKALCYFRKSDEIRESITTQIREVDYQFNLFESYAFMNEEVISLLERLSKKEDDKNFEKEAFEYIEKGKARLLLNVLGEIRENLRTNISGDIVKKINLLFAKVGALRKLHSEMNESIEKEKILQDIVESGEELRRLELKVTKENPENKSVAQQTSIGIDKVQKEILKDGNCAILDYYLGRENSFVFVVTQNNYKLIKLSKNYRDLLEDIKKLRRPFEKIKEDSFLLGELKKYDLDLAQELYSDLIKPALPYLERVKDLIIIPHFYLCYLPFEMLVSRIDNKELNENVLLSEYRRPHYLIEDFSISYSPSVLVLDPHLFKKTNQRLKKGDVLAFANPDFTEFSFKESDDRITNVFFTRSMREKIVGLPHTEKEVEEIKRYFKSPLIYMGKNATKENFIKNASDYNIIHVATHGFLYESAPQYSALIFAYNEEIEDLDLLYAYEIYTLDLDCDLITLSACETALGQKAEYVGGEGMLGLAKAFLYAGAKSLVVSLWKVSDESTSILMSEFYKDLKEKGLSKTEALREAKLTLMKSEKKIGNKSLSYSHPFFWAPFILIGESN